MRFKISQRYLRILPVLLLTMVACGLTACNSGQNSDFATFAVQIHDQAADFEEVNLHIKRVEIQQANGGEAGWKVIGEPDRTYNLLELINGNKVLLGKEEIEPARYTRARLILGEDNYVVQDGQSYELTLSGGPGISMNIDANLHEGDYYVLNLDFDALHSIKETEQAGSGYLLVPVIRPYAEAESGTVSGSVRPDEIRAQVKALAMDTVFVSTRTDDATGNFRLVGLEPGTYDIEIIPQLESFETKIKKGVEVNAGETTVLDPFDFGDYNLLDDENWSRQLLAPGVELLQQHYDNLFLAPQYISILKIDTSEPGVRVRITSTYLFDDVADDRLPVSELGEREGAIAATNPGHPRDGDVYNSGILKADGEVIPFLREEPNDDLKFIGGSAFGIDEDENWHFTERPGDRWPPDWSEVEHATAGSQMLISNGEITEHIEQEKFISPNENRHAHNRHPRTAVCLTADNNGILITVDGRADEADGMTLLELAQYMQFLGCEDAINLDGGGSTTMWTRDHGVVNHPSDNDVFDHNGQRDIRAAIIIKYNSN